MLTIRELKMTLGGRTLFENVALQLNYGDRVALVGPNGVGKSTLFSIILGQKEPDHGTVERDPWTMVGNSSTRPVATSMTVSSPMASASWGR